MLVLSRFKNETICVGEDVRITIIDIRGDKVRLGIEAPQEIAVHREEVFLAIKRENQQVARVSAKAPPLQAFISKDKPHEQINLPEVSIDRSDATGTQAVPLQPLQDAD